MAKVGSKARKRQPKLYGAPNVFASKGVPLQVTVPVKSRFFVLLLTSLTFHVIDVTEPSDKVRFPVKVPEMKFKLDGSDASIVGEKLTAPFTV